MLTMGGGYIKHPLSLNKKFNVIVIDGLERYLCAKLLKDCLDYEDESGFMVILDNSDWHTNTTKYIRDTLDLIEFDFHGFGPINAYTFTTSIFVSRNFNFKPINDVQPHFSLQAIHHYEDISNKD